MAASEHGSIAHSVTSLQFETWKAQFANGIDLNTADAAALRDYTYYRFQRYANRGTSDYPLWKAIQIDFMNFTVELMTQLDGDTWSFLEEYCYTHGYWIDNDINGTKTQASNFVQSLKTFGRVGWYQ